VKSKTQNTLVTQQRTSLDRGRGGHEIQALLEQIKNQLNPVQESLGNQKTKKTKHETNSNSNRHFNGVNAARGGKE
jgi:hypothetical protein